MTDFNIPASDWTAKQGVRDEQLTLSGCKGKSRYEWLAQSRDAMKAYNDHVQSHGVFSDGLRVF